MYCVQYNICCKVRMIIQLSMDFNTVVTSPSWAVKQSCCLNYYLCSCWALLSFQIVLLNSRQSLTQKTKNHRSLRDLHTLQQLESVLLNWLDEYVPFLDIVQIFTVKAGFIQHHLFQMSDYYCLNIFCCIWKTID